MKYPLFTLFCSFGSVHLDSLLHPIVSVLLLISQIILVTTNHRSEVPYPVGLSVLTDSIEWKDNFLVIGLQVLLTAPIITLLWCSVESQPLLSARSSRQQYYHENRARTAQCCYKFTGSRLASCISRKLLNKSYSALLTQIKIRTIKRYETSSSCSVLYSFKVDYIITNE